MLVKVGHTSKPLLQQQQHPSTNYTNLQYKHGNYLYFEKQDNNYQKGFYYTHSHTSGCHNLILFNPIDNQDTGYSIKNSEINN